MRSQGRFLIWTAITLAGVAVLYLMGSIVIPFILAFFLAYLIEPLVGGLQHRGAPRGLAILSVFTIAAILTAVLVAVVVPMLAADLSRAAEVIPGYLERADHLGIRLARLYNRLHLPFDVRGVFDRIASQAVGGLERTVAGTIASLLRLVPASIVLLIVPVIAYYISRDYHRARRTLYLWLARRARPDILAMAVGVDRVLNAYFRAQALEMLVMTGLLVLGLSLLGFEFAILLGILAGILNIIPYFGPILGAIPALLVALSHSPWHALYVILLFAAANQFEASLLVPRLIGGRVGLHPVVVIFVILMGGRFFGLIGLVAAVPAAAAVKVVIAEYSRTRSRRGA